MSHLFKLILYLLLLLVLIGKLLYIVLLTPNWLIRVIAAFFQFLLLCKAHMNYLPTQLGVVHVLNRM